MSPRATMAAQRAAGACGFLAVDKPTGMTTFDVVRRIRAAARPRFKVGHAGTLDPAATGVVVLMCGAATRLARFLPMEKRYTAEALLGLRTTSEDLDGCGVASPHALFDAHCPALAQLTPYPRDTAATSFSAARMPPSAPTSSSERSQASPPASRSARRSCRPSTWAESASMSCIARGRYAPTPAPRSGPRPESTGSDAGHSPQSPLPPSFPRTCPRPWRAGLLTSIPSPSCTIPLATRRTASPPPP